MKNVIVRVAIAAVLVGAAAHGLLAQRDWPTYGYDAGSSRFSPLTQINAGNVSRLARAWTYHTFVEMPAPQGQTPSAVRRGSQASPLVVDGVLYMPTPYGRVVALEAHTGKELWFYQSKNGAITQRGVEYWAGDSASKSPAMILFATTDGHLVGLNAATGQAVPTFGEAGLVDFKQGIDNGFPTGNISLSSPPKVYKHLLITGARVQERPALGFSGDTRAWDLRTGKLVWQFHHVPRPGEPGNDTWENDSWNLRSGVNTWGFISIDPALGLVYLPTGSPSYDFYGGDRKGENLYANSIVALEAETGKLKWYFQAVRHDTWDFDFTAAPVLIDVRRNGQRIPALAQVSKQGLVYILDRRDGKPIFGMEEKPVPPSDVPGEQNYPTQPVPVKPRAVARQGFTPAELARLTPEHEKVCSEMLATEGGMQSHGPFTRYNSTLSIQFPGTLGASNWHGASYSPSLGLLFMNVQHLADVGKVTKAPEGSVLPYVRNSPWGAFARFWWQEKYWPCQIPPWGEMVAIDVNTGDEAWRVPLGVIEELEAKGIRNTGTLNMGGSIATAGNVVFVGATNDRRFRAFDARNGKVLWEVQLEAGAYNTPITFQGKDGKQYVVAHAAGGGFYDRKTDDSLIAFSLP